MFKRKIFITTLITILSLIFFSSSINAIEIEKRDYSKRYEEWLKLSDDKKKDTIAPLPFNVRNERRSVFNVLKNTLKATQIPENYDLRDHITVEVKNQMNTGQCWAFTASTSLETYLALNGETYNFSERHIEYDTASNYIDGKKEDSLNRTLGSGGFSSTAFTYYSRGSGPILEEDMPFENNENMIQLADLPTNSAIQKVDDMVYFPNIYKYKNDSGELIYEDANGIEYTKTEIIEIRNKVKEHIMKNGAISVAVYAPAEFYNESTYSDNLNIQGYYSNHVVTIIGWDDNYNKENFINQPNENGAYIVLNSWGTEWGENGVYYVSYEDFLIESEMRGIAGVSDIEYDNLYQHDISEMWNCIGTQYAANVFTSEDNEILTEIMIGSLSEQICDIYINATSDDLNINDLTKIASNVKLNPGYNTIEIDSEIELISGNKFAIVVQLTNTDYTGIGIEDNNEVYFGNAKSNLGESFVSEDGINWTDIYDENNFMNLSIKAYTQAEEKSIEVSDIAGIGYEDIGGEFKFSVDTSYVEKGNTANISIYKENEDLTNEFNIKGNIIRGKGSYITIECPSNIKAGQYNVNIALSDFDTINKTFVVNETDSNLTVVQFEDENFFNYAKSKVQNCLKNSDELKIIAYKEEFEKVTDMSDAYLKDINDITGIEYFTNLEILNLNQNNVVDLLPLKDLENLEALYFTNNGCEDFSALNNLINLKELDISFNFVNDLTFLENLSQLEVLELDCSAPESEINIENIFKLEKLKMLGLTSWTWITENELQEISNLEDLESLDLTSCNIGDLEFLRNLKLSDLSLGNNSVLYNGTNHFSSLEPIGNMDTLAALSLSQVKEIQDLNEISNLTNLDCLWVQWGSLRDASVLDSDTFKNKEFWSNLWLTENYTEDEIEVEEDSIEIVNVPKIIEQASDENSLLYSQEGLTLQNCEWEEYGKSIKIDTSEFSRCSVYINSGYAAGTQYAVSIKGANNNDTEIGDIEDLFEKTYIEFPDINLYNAIKSKTPFGGYGIEFECFDDENKIYISKNDIEYITYLDLSSMDIVDIAGIENFTNLQTINLGYNNNLENIDVLSLLPQIKSIVLNGTKVENIECLINKESVEEIIIYKENLQVYNNKEEKIELPKYIYQSLKLQEGVTAKAVIYYDILDTTRGGGGDFPINDYNNFEIVNINLDDEKEVATIDLDRSITNEKKKGIRAIVVTIEGGKTLNSEYKCYYEVDKELTGISINGYTSDNYYFIEGQDFNRNGLQVVAMYNDGSSQEITDYQVVDGEDLKLIQQSVTITYTEDGITKTATQEIMVQAQNIEKLEINIEEYQEEQDGDIKYINNINLGVTAGQVLEKIQVNTGATKKVYDVTTEVLTDEILATGMKIVISLNSQVAEYIAVVSGDINGDGQITATDLTRMKNHILEKTTLTNIGLKAADLNNDGQITAAELTKIKKYVLGFNIQLH